MCAAQQPDGEKKVPQEARDWKAPEIGEDDPTVNLGEGTLPNRELPVRLVLGSKLERMLNIVARWKQEPKPEPAHILRDRSILNDLVALSNLCQVVKDYPRLLTPDQSRQFREEILPAVRERFDDATLKKYGIDLDVLKPQV